MEEGIQTNRILVVDDDSDVRAVFEEMLELHDFEVVTAASGEEALKHVHAMQFDAIVSDVSMPGLDGVGLLRAVRERDLDVAVVLITGAPTVQSAAQAVEHGAFRYLTKPIEMAAFLDLVLDAVRLSRLARIKRQALEHLGNQSRQFGDLASVDMAFERARRGLWIACQPIVEFPQRRVYAYEALLRSRDETLSNPVALLEAAERLGKLHELGRTVRNMVAQILTVAKGEQMFVNVHPADLDDPTLFDPYAPLSAVADRVVLELTERAPLDGLGDVRERIAALRKLGYRIAIDDIGAGYAGFNSIAQLEPEIMKVDMVLVRDVDSNPTRKMLVGALASLCHEMDSHMVAEGIETAAERDTVVGLGCNLLQGYLFAKPAEPFPVPTF